MKTRSFAAVTPACSGLFVAIVVKKFFTFLVLPLAVVVVSPVEAAAEWLDMKRNGPVAYFLFDFPARIERHDTSARTWYEPITLPSSFGLPTAFGVDEQNLFVGYGQAAYRYDLDGSNQLHMINVPQDIQAFHSDGDVIIIDHAVGYHPETHLTSIDRTTNTVIDTADDVWYSMQGSSISRIHNRIIGRNTGVSPSDIVYVEYNDNGEFGGSNDSPHHGDYPGASKTFMFPDENKVFDDSGNIYRVSDLQHLNSIPSTITDIDWFWDAAPIVLDDEGVLTSYNPALLPSGTNRLNFQPMNIFISDPDILTYTPDNAESNGVRVDSFPLSSLNPPTPGTAIDPHGLPYTPDNVFVDNYGTVYLLSALHQSVFRWNATSQTYITTLPLLDVPLYAAYSTESHLLYTAYSSGLIRKIDLTKDSVDEIPFATLPSTPYGLACAGSFVFSADGSGAWASHYTFSENGTLVEAVDWNYRSNDYVWNEANQKMYFFRDDTSPNDILYEEINADSVTYAGEPPGGIANKQDSPYHSSAGIQHPIRVKPDGSILVLGSGHIYNANSLERLSTTLSNTVDDIAFLNGEIYTLRTISGMVQFQEWQEPSLSLGTVVQVPGEAIQLLSVNDDVLVGVVMASNGIPSFYVMDGQLTVQAPADLEAPTGLQASVTSSQVDLSWNDVSGESSFTVERRLELTDWEEVATTEISVTTYSDGWVEPTVTYYYRVIAKNGNQSSLPSEEVVMVFGPPLSPVNVTASATSQTAITVSWNDVVGEEVYQIERKRGTNGYWSNVETVAFDSTMFQDTDLEPDTTYYYRIYSSNGQGLSNPSPEVNATTDPGPARQPYLPYPSVEPFEVYFSWEFVDNADEYILSRSTDDFAWNTIATLNSTEYRDTDVSSGTTYYYRLMARNENGDSQWSTVSVTVPHPSPPSTPYFYYLNAESFVVHLGWDHVSKAEQYILSRSTDGIGNWTEIAILNATGFGYSDTDVEPLTTYYYRIKAQNEFGDSDWSGYISGSTPRVPLSAPSLRAEVAPDLAILLRWTDPFDEWVGIEGEESAPRYSRGNSGSSIGRFVVERRSSGSDYDWVWIATLAPQFISFTDRNIIRHQNYTYRIRADTNDEGGSSPWSNFVNITAGYYEWEQNCTSLLPSVPSITRSEQSSELEKDATEADRGRTASSSVTSDYGTSHNDSDPEETNNIDATMISSFASSDTSSPTNSNSASDNTEEANESEALLFSSFASSAMLSTVVTTDFLLMMQWTVLACVVGQLVCDF